MKSYDWRIYFQLYKITVSELCIQIEVFCCLLIQIRLFLCPVTSVISPKQKRANPGTKCNREGRENYYCCEIPQKKESCFVHEVSSGLFRCAKKIIVSFFFSLQKTEMNSWRASCHPVSFGLCWNKLSLMSANLTVRHVVRGVSLRYSQIPKV